MGAITVAWQPRGEVFVTSGQDSRLALYNAEGALVSEQRPAMAWTTAVAWTSDGKRLATAAGKQITLWSPSLEKEHVFAPSLATVVALGWDKPGRDLGAAINGGLMVHRV